MYHGSPSTLWVEMPKSLLNQARTHDAHRRQLLSGGQCKAGASVSCPAGGTLCAGNQCCPDGTWHPFERSSEDLCLFGNRNFGCSILLSFDVLFSTGTRCKGTICPSANDSFTGCPIPKKTQDCTKPGSSDVREVWWRRGSRTLFRA